MFEIGPISLQEDLQNAKTTAAAMTRRVGHGCGAESRMPGRAMEQKGVRLDEERVLDVR